MEQRSFNDSEIERKLIQLSQRLHNTKGKKVYGYLQKDVKMLIDSIADRLAENDGIAGLYDLCYEKKFETLKTYTSELPPKIPLSKNKEFKSIKNEIIREALKIQTDKNGAVHILHAKQKLFPYTSASTIAIRLFRHLSNILQTKIAGDDSKQLTVIDKRLRREIEEKKNAEISLT